MGDFEGGLHACSCRSKPICNNLIGHAFLERVVKDMIADATARQRMNNEAAVYINDEKNAWEPANRNIDSKAKGLYYFSRNNASVLCQ